MVNYADIYHKLLCDIEPESLASAYTLSPSQTYTALDSNEGDRSDY